MLNLAVHEVTTRGWKVRHIILLFSLEAERKDPHPHGHTVTIAMIFLSYTIYFLSLSSHYGDLTIEFYDKLISQNYVKMHI
jgi:hypothetical protein